VADNGVGFAPDVQSLPLEASTDEGESIGLHNVHDRIQLLFGKDFGVTVRSAGPGQDLLAESGYNPAVGIRTIVSIRLHWCLNRRMSGCIKRSTACFCSIGPGS